MESAATPAVGRSRKETPIGPVGGAVAEFGLVNNFLSQAGIDLPWTLRNLRRFD
jgi:hypothetical protein